jgi:hypothetical protein
MIREQRLCIMSIVSFFMAFLIVTAEAQTNQCRLVGKSITIDVVICPDRQSHIGPDCTRGRMRYDILTKNVLEYADEVTPRGIKFELDKTVDVSEHMRGDTAIPNTYIKAQATASYANHRLGLNTERNRYFNDGTLVQRITFLKIIEVSPDCLRCSVTRFHVDTMLSIPGKTQTRNIELLAQQSCEIRPST